MFKKTVHELFRCKGSRLFVILMLVNFALSCVMPALNGGFVDFLVTNRDPSRVVWFAAFVAGIGISASFMSYAMGVNVSRVILEMTTRLMGTTCESFERGPLEKGEQADPSYTTQRVYADSNAVSSFVVNNFLTIGLNVVLVVLICIILFSINPVFLVLSACSLVAYFILFRALKKPLYNSSLANKEGLSKLFASVSGELSQLFDIKCDGAYNQSARTLKGVFEGYYPIYMKASRVSNLATSSDGLISSVFRGGTARDLRDGNIERKNELRRVHNGELVLLDGVRMLQVFFELFQIVSGRKGLVRPIGGSDGGRRGPRHPHGWARGEHIVVQHRVPIRGKALLIPRPLRGGGGRKNLCHYRAERMRKKHVSEGAPWTIFCWGTSGFGVGAI